MSCTWGPQWDHFEGSVTRIFLFFPLFFMSIGFNLPFMLRGSIGDSIEGRQDEIRGTPPSI